MMNTDNKLTKDGKKESKDWKNIKASVLLEFDQFLKKKHLEELGDKVRNLFQETKKELNHIVHERDLSRVKKIVDKEKKEIEIFIEKKVRAEIDRAMNFLETKKHKFEDIQQKFEKITGIDTKLAKDKAEKVTSKVTEKLGEKAKALKKTTKTKTTAIKKKITKK